jgi:hypothetical protein
MTIQAEWRKAIQRFILNNLGQMDQEDVEAWLDDELDIAPLLEDPMKAQAQHRDQILRELHQMSPSEIFDRFQKEHPELVFSDNDKAIVKIGKEIEGLKAIVLAL